MEKSHRLPASLSSSDGEQSPDVIPGSLSGAFSEGFVQVVSIVLMSC